MASADDLPGRLRALIHDVPDFPRPGIVFRDITGLLADGPAFHDAVDAIVDAHRDDGIESVAAIESRGFVLGGAVAYALGAGFVAVRKGGRLPRTTISQSYALEYGEAVLEVHADALPRRERVLVVDDLLATGGTAAAALTLLERLGAEVAGLAFLVELTGLGGAAALAGRPYTALVII